MSNDSTLPLRDWLIIMLLPITSVAVCIGIAFSSEEDIVQSSTVPFIILTSALVMNVLAFMMYDNLVAQSKALLEHERAENLMKTDLRRYEAMIAQRKEIAALLHDTCKHRDAVYDLLVSGDSPAAISYLESLRSAEPMHDRDSAKAAVNAMLHRKLDKAAQLGIVHRLQ